MGTLPCPSCGSGVAVDAKVCPKCGGQVSVARLLVAHRPWLALGIFIACLAFLGYCYYSYQHQ